MRLVPVDGEVEGLGRKAQGHPDYARVGKGGGVHKKTLFALCVSVFINDHLDRLAALCEAKGMRALVPIRRNFAQCRQGIEGQIQAIAGDARRHLGTREFARFYAIHVDRSRSTFLRSRPTGNHEQDKEQYGQFFHKSLLSAGCARRIHCTISPRKSRRTTNAAIAVTVEIATPSGVFSSISSIHRGRQ